MGVGPHTKPVSQTPGAKNNEPVDEDIDSGWDEGPSEGTTASAPAVERKEVGALPPGAGDRTAGAAPKVPKPLKASGPSGGPQAPPAPSDRKPAAVGSAARVVIGASPLVKTPAPASEGKPAKPKAPLPPRPSGTSSSSVAAVRPLTAASGRKPEPNSHPSVRDEKRPTLPEAVAKQEPKEELKQEPKKEPKQEPKKDLEQKATNEPERASGETARSSAEPGASQANSAESAAAERNALPSIPPPSQKDVLVSEFPSLDPGAFLDAQAPVSTRDAGTLRPSELDPRPAATVPPPRRTSRWVLPIAAMLGVAAVGVVGLRQRARSLQASAETRAAAAPAPAPRPERAPTPAQPAPAEVAVANPVPAPAAPEALPSASAAPADKPPEPQLSDAFAAALSASPTSVKVSVRVTPEGAAIFDGGKRVGSDTVQVNVEPGAKVTLYAILNGHQPRRFSVDGSNASVNIALKPLDPGAPAAAGEAPSPGAGTPPRSPGKPAAVAPAQPFDPSRDVGAL